MAYSPERRTALVLCGTGAHGAYHAGVLRALQEAGVKIDVVAGQGIGAAGAALTAIDGASRLWDATGVWRSPELRTLYQWKASLRVAGWLALLVVGVLLTPLLFLAMALIVYPFGFLLEMFGAEAGQDAIAAYSAWLQTAFAGENLPTTVPRVAMITLAAVVLTALSGAMVGHWRAPAKRRARGGWLWRSIGAPLDSSGARNLFAGTIWQLIRGAAAASQPSPPALGRRYAEVLSENLGQPGFRELMIVAHDLDTRRELVGALLRETYRRDFLSRRPGRERQAEALDLAGIGREYAIDLISGALTPPMATDPHLLTFAPDGFWRGETHRLCDRPGAVGRLLEELRDVSVEQAIVVGAVPMAAGPHRLDAPRLDVRHRLGDLVSAFEASALRDAFEQMSSKFELLNLICPAHNPIGPFDFDGAYDESSDRRQTILELMHRGYEDAYRQFIEPVVGASGEHLVIGGGVQASAERAHGQGVLDDADSSR